MPLVAEINFGHAANPDTRSSFGGFGGLGFGYSKIGAKSDTYEATYNKAAGLVVNGGIRALIGARSSQKSLGLRVSYLLNFIKGYDNVIGVGVFYTFGDF